MGGLFDSGPSDSDIRQREEAAYEREQERLRLQEIALRKRESQETAQGEGIATPSNITLGSDLEDVLDGGEDITLRPDAVLNPSAQNPGAADDAARREAQEAADREAQRRAGEQAVQLALTNLMRGGLFR